MFNDIYPRDASTDHENNVHRLTEELGELCEAVRTLSVAPEYFVSEAPDVFAWLMGFANQFDFDNRESTGVPLERQMIDQYPSECRKCRRQICKCPPIHPDTLGRIAKEAPLGVAVGGRLFSLQESIQLFKKSAEEIEVAGRTIYADENEMKSIRNDIQQVLSLLEKQTDWQVEVIVGVAAALGGMERLAAQGELTQRTIDDLRSTLEAMPSEKRTVLVGFLNNLAASGTFQALAVGLQAIVT